MDGSTEYIDLKIAPVLYVKFGMPAITPDEFFDSKTLVGNFAQLLGVDASKIRKVQIVRAKSNKKKKRQSNEMNYVVLTLYDDAAQSLNDTTTVNQLASTMNKLDAKISNMFMTGELQQLAKTTLNITIAAMSLQRPNSTIQQVTKVAKIVVLNQADKCFAQAPCLIQPKLMVVDENVI